MSKEWIMGIDGQNLKFKRETLLNYGMNRWGLNKAHSVGSTSELIRSCAPKNYEEWENYYFDNAKQKKINGMRITREYLNGLGGRLYIKLSEVVHNELSDINEEECVDYVYNLVLNRTYEGYRTEIVTIYGHLEKELNIRIKPAPDILDRTYNVDFIIEINGKFIGLQIKPIATGRALDYYRWDEMHETNHLRFTGKFGGKVFFVYSVKSGNKKDIYNKEVIREIKEEIIKLSSL